MSGVPCATCPWRVENTADVIPHFDPELARNLLRTTCGPDQGFRKVMACHGSACGAETPCVGYLASDDGYRNFAARLLGALKNVDWDACAALNLHTNYRDVLDKLVGGAA